MYRMHEALYRFTVPPCCSGRAAICVNARLRTIPVLCYAKSVLLCTVMSGEPDVEAC